ncbi:MAG: hypothetical protein DME22_03965 [Verrucomicrobia bacterium]|nr:MAG: hypothetical protein DME22_03965 [Verrucomicrobiota bacterium]
MIRAPDGGIQPQAAVDAKGVVHLIYFKGEPQGGDIFYARRKPGEEAFSPPMRVNRQAASAIATGTIRGAQLAIGRNGRVHVAWMGGQGAARVTVNGKEATPMLYTRSNDADTAFEPERNLITWAAGLDGGGSVAADLQGNVYVVWHASPPGNQRGEAGRAVFVAHSTDEGGTFKREEQANRRATGACGCCGLRAFADSKGRLYIVYRAADEMSRDMTLLVSRDHAANFEVETVNQWMIKSCPMSSCAFAESDSGVVAATERDGQVYFNVIEPETLSLSRPAAAPGGEKRKHPVVAANSKGEVLIAWTEGTAWQKGGALGWQLFDKHGKATAEKGHADGVPVWSLPAAFAQSDGSFMVVY